MHEHVNDPYVQRAQKDGYRARAQEPHAVLINAEDDAATVFAHIRPHLDALRHP